MDYQWCDLADVLRGIDATPWAFSPWMVMQAANSEARILLSALRSSKNPDICRVGEHNVTLISPDASPEQNNVADGMAVGEQHYHTVDASPDLLSAVSDVPVR